MTVTMPAPPPRGEAARPEVRTPRVEIVRATRVRFARGEGTAESPYREVRAWFDEHGQLLVELDPILGPYTPPETW